METRVSISELSAERGVIAGVALRYATPTEADATPHGIPEVIESEAFRPIGRLTLNKNHDMKSPPIAWTSGNMQVSDNAEALSIRATVDRDSDIYRDVQAGRYKLSVEFEAIQAAVVDGVRRVTRGVLHGVGLVRESAYPQTFIEARGSGLRIETRQGVRTISGATRYGVDETMADRGTVRKRRFNRGVFADTLRRSAAEAEIILAIGRGNNRPLGSRRAETLELEDSAESLRFSAKLPPPGKVQYVDDFVSALAEELADFGIVAVIQEVPVGVVPQREQFFDEPEVPGSAVHRRVYTNTSLRGISLVSRGKQPGSKITVRRNWTWR